MNLPTIEEIQKVLPVADLAKIAGFGRRTLYTWLENGDVPGRGLAREYRIKAIRDALEHARAESGAAQPKDKPARPKRRRPADGAGRRAA